MNHIVYEFDYIILNMLHKFAEATNRMFTPFFRFVSLFAENGFFFIFLGIVLISFKKTRRGGICVLFALAFGAIITNLVLKNMISRPRPFSHDEQIFYTWWQYVGSIDVKEFSFPSGHTTATMAVMTALFLNIKHKCRWLLIVPVILMGLSRNYLMVHYPSDILGGIAVGALSGCIAFFVTKVIMNAIENKPKHKQ